MKKLKITSLILAALMILTLIPVGMLGASAAVTATADWYDETATELTVDDAADLWAFATAVSEGKTFEGQTVKLTADITVNDGWDAKAQDPKNPTVPTDVYPMAADKYFAGTFDGQGYTISGLYMKADGIVGLFGNVPTDGNAVVKNVTITNSMVLAGAGKAIGGIFGMVNSESVTAIVHPSTHDTFPYVGKTSATIENVVNDIVVYTAAAEGGASGIAGFVGLARADVTIKNSRFEGFAAGGSRGLAAFVGSSYVLNGLPSLVAGAAASSGYRNKIVVENCVMAGEVNQDVRAAATQGFAGAVVGYANDAVMDLTVKNFYSNSNIVGSSNVAALYGGSWGGTQHGLVTTEKWYQLINLENVQVANNVTKLISNLSCGDITVDGVTAVTAADAYTMCAKPIETLPLSRGAIWDGVSVDKDFPETGDIIIDTAAKLAGLAEATNEFTLTDTSTGAFAGRNIYITKNLELLGYNWTPMGDEYGVHHFAGNLEGRLDGVEGAAITISGLFIDCLDDVNVGFIGTFRGGSMKNITFNNAEVLTSCVAQNAGIAVGYASKNIALENIIVMNSRIENFETNGTVGGVFGYIKSDVALTLKNIAFIDGEIIASAGYVGGILGFVQVNADTALYTLDSVFVSGKIAVEGNVLGVGGLIGYAAIKTAATEVFTLNNVQSDMIVVGTGSTNTGALVGYSNGTVAINNALVTGFGKDYNSISWFGSITATNLTATNAYTNSGFAIYKELFGTAVNAVDLANNAATVLTGFDFTDVWVATANGPVLKFVSGIASVEAIDHLWLNTTDKYAINIVDNEAEMASLAMLSHVIGADEYLIFVHPALAAVANGFAEDFEIPYMAATGPAGADGAPGAAGAAGAAGANGADGAPGADGAKGDKGDTGAAGAAGAAGEAGAKGDKGDAGAAGADGAAASNALVIVSLVVAVVSLIGCAVTFVTSKKRV